MNTHNIELWSSKKVFITGGTGLLGSHITRCLIERGAHVVALVRDSVPRSLFFSNEQGWSLDKKATVVRGDLKDYFLLERTINEYEIDTIFHLGAQTIVGYANKSPMETFKTNIEGTWNILEAARQYKDRIQAILIASSDKAYGNLSGASYTEDFPLRGEHPYDVSKSSADLIARSYFVSYGLPVVITRCGNFFGPGDLNFNRLIPGTIQSLLQNQPPIIRSNGEFIRDYIYVEDGADAYVDLSETMFHPSMQKKILGEAFNFSYGLKKTVLEVVADISSLMNIHIAPIIQHQANNEIPIQTLDSSKAKKLLDWKPNHGFSEGLKKTIDWYKTFLG